MELWTEIITELLAKIPGEAIDKREFFMDFWSKLKIRFGLESTDVIILGRPNVGKTVLAQLLKTGAEDILHELPPASRDIETLPFSRKIIKVIPGQEIRERKFAINKAFNSKKLVGIIYVVDWGYTNLRHAPLRKEYIKNRKIDTIEKIREHNLKSELSHFEKTMTKIADGNKKNKIIKWIIIAVNKVDLFYDKLDEAQEYYLVNSQNPSDFTKILMNTVNLIGEQNIECISLPICSTRQNFEWNNHKVNTNLADRDIHRALTIFFLTQLKQLLE